MEFIPYTIDRIVGTEVEDQILGLCFIFNIPLSIVRE